MTGLQVEFYKKYGTLAKEIIDRDNKESLFSGVGAMSE